jgi:hypothetical protein
MKIRTGFVSNSSSSSFIVAFQRIPQNVDELRVMMFGDRKTHAEVDEPVSTYVLADIVWSDLQGQLGTKGLTRDEIAKRIAGGGFPGEPSFDYYRKPVRKADSAFQRRFGKNPWDEGLTIEEKMEKIKIRELDHLIQEIYDRDVLQSASVVADRFLTRTKGATVFFLEFSDNEGGAQAELEHGDCFANFEHIRVSHH